jgi:hypothetical protein
MAQVVYTPYVPAEPTEGDLDWLAEHYPDIFCAWVEARTAEAEAEGKRADKQAKRAAARVETGADGATEARETNGN